MNHCPQAARLSFPVLRSVEMHFIEEGRLVSDRCSWYVRRKRGVADAIPSGSSVLPMSRSRS